MPRTIHCAKLQKDAPGLDAPPFSGELGQQIYERVSAEAWKMWADDMMIKIINEYRLNMIDPNDYAKLLEQMSRFLNLNAEGSTLEVENASRGRA